MNGFDEVINCDMTNSTLDFHNRKCLLIEAEQGAGKTLATMNTLLANQYNSILFITYRVSLGKKYDRDVIDLPTKFVNYQDIDRRISCKKYPYLIIQLDSLHRIIPDQSWDLVIIDEIDSVLGHFASNLMRHKHDNSMLIDWIVNFNQKMVCLDANLNSLRVNHWINNFYKEDEIWFLKNKFIRPTNRKLRIFNEIDQFYGKLKQAMIDKKKIVIVSTSKSELDKLNVFCTKFDGNLKTKFYTSDNSIEAQNDDIKFWNKLDILGYSPTITSGVSFVPLHFDCIFCYGSSMSCDTKSFYQMLGRVRQLRDGDMYCFLDPKTSNFPVTIPEIEKYISDIHNDTININYLIRQIKMIDGKPQYYYPIKDWTYTLFIDNLQNDFISNNNFKAEFIEFCCKKHLPVMYNDVVEAVVIPKEDMTLQESDIFGANALTLEQMEELKNKEIKTSGQRLDYLVQTCINTYNINRITLAQNSKLVNWKSLNIYHQRQELVGGHDTIFKILDKGDMAYQTINNNSEFFDNDKNHYTIWIISCLLMEVLKLKSFNSDDIKNWTVTGRKLQEQWQAELPFIARNIEKWTFHLRVHIGKIVKSDKCLKWNKNISFVRFLNRIIKPILGLELMALKNKKHSGDKALWGFVDIFSDIKFKERKCLL